MRSRRGGSGRGSQGVVRGDRPGCAEAGDADERRIETAPDEVLRDQSARADESRQPPSLGVLPAASASSVNPATRTALSFICPMASAMASRERLLSGVSFDEFSLKSRRSLSLIVWPLSLAYSALCSASLAVEVSSSDFAAPTCPCSVAFCCSSVDLAARAADLDSSMTTSLLAYFAASASLAPYFSLLIPPQPTTAAIPRTSISLRIRSPLRPRQRVPMMSGMVLERTIGADFTLGQGLTPQRPFRVRVGRDVAQCLER